MRVLSSDVDESFGRAETGRCFVESKEPRGILVNLSSIGVFKSSVPSLRITSIRVLSTLVEVFGTLVTRTLPSVGSSENCFGVSGVSAGVVNVPSSFLLETI